MKYSERVAIAKKFVDKNKLFTVLALIAVCYLGGNFLFSKVNPDSDAEPIQEEVVETAEKNSLQWRFYWSDLVVLAVAGGFCTVMIIRERKKERDNL
ncbi:MAG: hypothetical protein IJJ69_06835 [Oscillospiraceae bacterium]|nr:hypothetical protein [Oscillospiraceae bacterium]